MYAPQPIIRPARAQDLDALVGLLQQLFGLEADFDFHGPTQRAGLSALLDRDRAGLFVAEVEGEAVGMCSGQLVASTAEGGDAVLVEDVVVHQAQRGRALGKGLLAALEGWAVEHGASRLQLLADRDNASAMNFYAHLGWRLTRLVCLRKRLNAEART